MMEPNEKQVEIDESSGFCFGVTTAIKKAEEELAKGDTLYCLGDIVHNGQECERLKGLGLITIDHERFARLSHVKVLLRAHGEPPQTYQQAQANNIEIIDATCPVVLRLQKRIKQEFDTESPDGKDKQIVIFGKNGHAEVLGLVGQTNGKAIVIENLEEAKRLDFAGKWQTVCPKYASLPPHTIWYSSYADTKVRTAKYFSKNAIKSIRTRIRLTNRKK